MVTNGTFGAPAAVAGLHSANAEERSPLLAPDGLTLYFSRFVKTDASTNDYKIHAARRPTKSDPFGAPTPVSELNGPGWEVPAWISDDGCRMYFSRRLTQPSSGKIYVASRPSR